MDRIVFFSESQLQGRVPRDFENARTEFGWSIMLDAEWCPIGHIPKGKIDLGIIIVPKNNPNINIEEFKKHCDKVAIMQEGPHWFFQDYPIPHQFNFVNLLVDADWVYCHNQSDVKYYEGIGCKDVRVMRSMMVPEGLEASSKKSNGTIIGGNFVQWYGGFDSYVVAREIPHPIVAPSMGRKQQDENLIEDITYLPYMNWREWIKALGNYRIGVHLMRTHAAGTFNMNCAFHGIPCIGYKGLDTQELLHKELSVDIGDLRKAKKLIKQLNDDESFYNDMSSLSKERFQQHYSEDAWLKYWRKQNG